MRLSPFLIVLSLLALFVAATPAEARPAPACTDLRSNQCPEFVCVDSNLDGVFTWEECIGMACPYTGCCGGPCPPPPADSSSTCTGYVNVLGSKQRTCADPTRAPECGAYTESYSWIGYSRACYGTAALCNPYSGCPVLACDLVCLA